MYSDQLSAVDHIFRDENFDSPQLREAIGRFLMGAYDTDIYANQLRIRELDKELAAADATLRGIYALLADVNHSLTLDWAVAERRNVEEQLIRLGEEASRAEAALYEDDGGDVVSLEPQKRALEAVRAAQNELASVDQQIEGLQLAAEEIHLDLSALPPAVVDDPVLSDRRRLGRTGGIDLQGDVLRAVVAQRGVPELVTDQERPCERVARVLVADRPVARIELRAAAG